MSCLPSVQARANLEHFQVDPSSGISSISLAELLKGVVPVDPEVCIDSGIAGARREKREGELHTQLNPLIANLCNTPYILLQIKMAANGRNYANNILVVLTTYCEGTAKMRRRGVFCLTLPSRKILS